MPMGWPWDRWDVLDTVAVGFLAWLLLAIVAAVVLGRAIRLADQRELGRLRHAPPPGWIERHLPETATPPAGSQGAGGDGVGAGAGRRGTP